MFVTWLLELICQTIVPYTVVEREKQENNVMGQGKKKRKKPFWIWSSITFMLGSTS
jgi:hypothetical protein